MQPNNSSFPVPPTNGAAPTPQYQGVPTGVPVPQAGQPQMYQPQQLQPQPQQMVQQPVPAAPIGSNTPAKPTPKNPNSTQSTLQLSELRDGMVIMLDGSFRAVIACKSINFDLMSDREREGVEYSYQNFLNSLTFPVQILVRSQRVDIGPYIEKLINIRRTQDNMLLGVLMDDYIGFMDALAQDANIMEKSFYVVVPYFPLGDAANIVEQSKGFFGKLFARPQNGITKIDTAAYQKAKDEIKNRVDVVVAGMFQIGVQSTQLDTKALGELYYNFYNPDTAVNQPLGNFDNVATTFVKKAPNPNAQSPTQNGGY
jgi:hypothetical protein